MKSNYYNKDYYKHKKKDQKFNKNYKNMKFLNQQYV